MEEKDHVSPALFSISGEGRTSATTLCPLSLFLRCESHGQMIMPTYENHLQKQNQLIAYDSHYSEGHPRSHKVHQGQK